MTSHPDIMRQLMNLIEQEEKSKLSIQSCYKAGKKAFYAGAQKTENPYEKGKQSWEAWDRGFKDAKSEDEGYANW